MTKQTAPFFPFPDDINKQMEQRNNQIRKQMDIELRERFKEIIQPSFLIKMKYYIMESSEFNEIVREKYDPMGYIQRFDIDWVTVEDVCKHIVGIHNYNMLGEKNPSEFEDETRKGKPYMEKLKQQVLDNIKFREFGRCTSINKYYPYGYYPYLHAIRVTINFLLIQICRVYSESYDKVSEKEKLRIRTSSDIYRRAKGILGLVDDNCTDACYGICRQIIELYAQYDVLMKYPMVG